MNGSIRLPLLWAALCGLMVFTPVRAADVEASLNITDQGDFFTAASILDANKTIERIKADHKREVRIETFAGIPDDKKANYIEGERAAFFSAWAREREAALKVNGIYILICKQPSYLQVDVGPHTAQHIFTLANRDALKAQLVSGFKMKQFDSALVSAMNYVQQTMDANAKTTTAAAPVQHHANGAAPPQAEGSSWLGPILVFGGIIFAVMLLVMIMKAMSGGGAGGGMGGGGGLMTGLLGGIAGAFMGNWLYNSFFGGNHVDAAGSGGTGDSFASDANQADTGSDFAQSGDSFDSDSGGGDFGDSGGGDF